MANELTWMESIVTIYWSLFDNKRSQIYSNGISKFLAKQEAFRIAYEFNK